MWRPLLWLTWPLLRCASSPLLTVEVRPEDAAWADAMHPASNFGSICWRWGFNATRCDEHLALWTRVHRRAHARSRLVDAEIAARAPRELAPWRVRRAWGSFLTATRATSFTDARP